jgi:parallel beta-helix repeat protein
MIIMIKRVLHFLKALVVFAILLPTAVAAATLSVAEMNGLDSAYAQPPPIIKIIKDDATGGDCTSIGTWNRITETCTLRIDLTDTRIHIDSDRITFNGNGHTIIGDSGTGVTLIGRTGVTVKNLMIDNFDYGISLQEYSDGNTLSDNTIIGSTSGMGIHGLGSNNILRDNIVSIKYAGIVLKGSDNTVTRNTVTSNLYYGIVLEGPDNTVTRNTVNANLKDGIVLQGSDNTVKRNTVRGNSANGIVLGDTSTVIRNTVIGNDAHGIACCLGGSGDNILALNTANLNREFGYFDQTFGSGTAETASIYLTNKCLDNVSGGSNPAGLCSTRR